MKNIKSKKVLLFLCLLVVLGIVGTTFAYVVYNGTFNSIFPTSNYIVEAVDYFESPSNWKPGDVTPKEIIVTNKGNTDVAVRVSFEERWVDANNNPLPLINSNNMTASILNYSDDVSNWFRKGNYFYYYKKLAKNESTTPLLQSVTFNPEIVVDQCTEENGVVSCRQTAGDYSGGIYTINFKVETAQYNQYRNVFGYDVSIAANASPQKYVYFQDIDRSFFLWEPINENDFLQEESEITNLIYFRFTLLNQQIVHSTLVFKYQNNTYYMEPGLSHIEENMTLFRNLFGEANCPYIEGYGLQCDGQGSYGAEVYEKGGITISTGTYYCGIMDSGQFGCWSPVT